MISNLSLDWERGLSYKRFFRIVLDAWVSQLALQRHRDVMKLILRTPEEAELVVSPNPPYRFLLVDECLSSGFQM